MHAAESECAVQDHFQVIPHFRTCQQTRSSATSSQSWMPALWMAPMGLHMEQALATGEEAQASLALWTHP